MSIAGVGIPHYRCLLGFIPSHNLGDRYEHVSDSARLVS